MRLFVVFGFMLGLAACSGGGGSLGNFNLANWFSGGGAQSATAVRRSLAPRRGYAAYVETRPLIAQVSGLWVDKTSSGAIVRATGLAPHQGFHSADLVIAKSSRKGVLTFEFRAQPPGSATSGGPAYLREITAGTFLSHAQLNGIRRIRVIAAQNSRTARH